VRPAASGKGPIRVPGDVRRALDVSEGFAHGFGVAVILLSVWVLDRGGRRQVVRIAACAFGAGLLADVGKALVARLRPIAPFEVERVWNTFIGWLPVFRPEAFADYERYHIRSFPSGHSATAVALALALAWRYPRGWWLFAILAVLSMAQRVVSGAHYPSDTLAAAAIACLFCGVLLDPRLLGRVFDLLEWPRAESSGGEK
jgi:membrane-associated phospholipid phosphatase